MDEKNSLYNLVIPFKITLDDDLSNVDEKGIEFKLPNGRKVRLRKFKDYCDFSLIGFKDSQEAEESINSARLYIYWISLTARFKVTIEKGFQQPYYPTEHEICYENQNLRKGGRISALVSNLVPYVVRANSSVTMSYALPAKVTLAHGTEKMKSAFRELDIGNSESLICSDDKLMLALEIYNNIDLENSLSSKFLMINSAIEALITPKMKSKSITEMLALFKSQIDDAILELDSKDKNISGLRKLKQGLDNLKKESIRGSIETLTNQAFTILGRTDGDKYGRLSKKAYDVRSTLVHTGSVDDNELRVAYTNMTTVVEAILRAKILFYNKFKQAK